MTYSDADSAAGVDRTRWRAFAVCVGVAVLTILDLSKLNVGLPPIEQSLGAGSTELQLLVAGYALAFGLTLVPSGRLGDVHSRKAMFVIGLSLFTIASLVCALAPGIEVLLMGRIAQGLAAGVQMPQVIGLIQELFQGRERGRAFGLFGALIGVSTAFGPTLGGLLIGIGGPQDGWRLLFWMNVPLGLAAIAFAWWLLPARQRSGIRMELDLVGVTLLGIATLSVMLPFVFTTGSPDDDPARWWWLVVFAVALTAFVLWERRYLASGKTPVLHLRLLALSSYRNGLLIAMTYFAAMPAMFLVATLYLQQGLGLEPVFAGMVGILFALVSAVTSWIGGNLVDRVGRPLVVIGLVTSLVGIALVILAAVLPPPDVAPWLMAIAMAVTGAGGGFVMSPNQTLTLADIPVTHGGVAGSLTQVAQRVGTAIGVAAATALYFGTIYVEEGQLSRLEVYHDAFRNGYLACFALVALALVFALLDLTWRRRSGTPMTPNPEPAPDLPSAR